MPNPEPISLVPGLLFVLATKVTGGVHYQKRDLDPGEEADPVIDGDTGAPLSASGGEKTVTTKWETTKTIDDAEEFDRATKIRSECRTLIMSALVQTPFGFSICPMDQEPALDERIAQAKAKAAIFNSGAVHTRIDIFPNRGVMAQTKAEAVEAVQVQCATLLKDLNAAISAGEVSTIRELSGKLTQMGKLQEKQSSARGALDRAVAAARKIARDVKRAAVAGERVADVLEKAKTSPIASARFVFTGGAEGELDDLFAEGPEEQGLPTVAVGRFASMGGGEEDETTQEGATTIPVAEEAVLVT